MSDPSLLPEGTGEIVKSVSTAGGGGILALLLGRIFKGQDKATDQILAEMKTLTANVSALTIQVALLGRTVTDVASLQATVTAQGLEIAALKATLDELKDGLLR